MKIVVAIDRKGAIGRRGDLLAHLSDDLRRFKALTTGHTVIMGRKTFESLPKGALPNRRNIVVTRNADYNPAGAETARSLEVALAMATDDAFVIGGGEIYRLALPLADTLYLTVIDAGYDDADTFFPTLPLNDFRIDAIEDGIGEPNHKFYTLSRK